MPRLYSPEQAAELLVGRRKALGLSQAEVAARLGISTQAANYRLTGAGAGAIRRALHAWETTEEAG